MPIVSFACVPVRSPILRGLIHLYSSSGVCRPLVPPHMLLRGMPHPGGQAKITISIRLALQVKGSALHLASLAHVFWTGHFSGRLRALSMWKACRSALLPCSSLKYVLTG